MSAIIITLLFMAAQVTAFFLGRRSVVFRLAHWKRNYSDKFTGNRQYLEHLAEYLHSTVWLLVLHKLAVTAPLLGVVITAAGFLSHQGDIQETAHVLRSLQPLYFGVLAGSVLAIFNQILLFFLGCRIQRLYESEEAALPLEQNNFLEAEKKICDFAAKIQNLVPALDRLLEGMTNQAADNADKLVERMESLGQSIQRIADALVRNTASIDKSCRDFRKTLEAHLASFQNEVEVFHRTIVTAGDNMRTFCESCEKKLGEIDDRSKKSVDSHAESVVQFRGQVAEVTAGVRKFQKSAETYMTTVDKFGTGVQKFLESILRRTADAISESAREYGTNGK